MDEFLSRSLRFQLTNGDLLAFFCWWAAATILIEIPRVMRWIEEVCNAANIF